MSNPKDPEIKVRSPEYWEARNEALQEARVQLAEISKGAFNVQSLLVDRMLQRLMKK